ncbi:MAG: hypothetical protein O3A63_12850 [Proteobacteria bacterium]|nr:hypothetical protein [Pseudomonadota bacterium]
MLLDVIGKSFRTMDHLYRVVDARHVGGEWILYAEDEDAGQAGPHRAALRYSDVVKFIDGINNPSIP